MPHSRRASNSSLDGLRQAGAGCRLGLLQEGGGVPLHRVLAKLAEALFIEVPRIHMNDQAEGRTGWLAGVNDRTVDAALRAVHAEPARAWVLEDPARVAGSSRSALAERFQQLVGQAPMQ